MAIIPLLLSLTQLNFMLENGLVENLFWILMINMLVTTFLVLCLDVGMHLDNLAKWKVNKFLKRVENFKKNPSKENLTKLVKGKIYTHGQARTTLQARKFDLAGFYSTAFSAMNLTLFYFNLVPYGTIFMLIALILSYFTSKVCSEINLSTSLSQEAQKQSNIQSKFPNSFPLNSPTSL